ncbi:MAG: FG-GAP-like repeat-containing protein [Chloroherpetonaceae bacterium]|nr:FG-GAP-like repeat-containing protein [Chloroherpetonaceae bacterium]
MKKFLLTYLIVTPLLLVHAFAQIAITSFTPSSGNVGTSVTITGSGFNTTVSNNVVRFGATRATASTATATQLVVSVPAGATNDFITVTNPQTNGTGVSKLKFTPTFSPTESISEQSFSWANQSDFPNESAFQLAADFDDDGKTDYLALFNNGTFGIYKNRYTNGAEYFDTPITLPANVTLPVHAAVGDLDNDGKPEVVLVNQSSNAISIYRNISVSGTISFGTPFNIIGFSSPSQVAIADIDQDGKLDLIVANASGSSGISLVRNVRESESLGEISFKQAFNVSTGLSNNEYFAVGDLNNDGKGDISVGNRTQNSLVLLRNTASSGDFTSSTFASPFTLNVGNPTMDLTLSDLNNDGRLDFVFLNESGTSSLSLIQNNVLSGNFTVASFGAPIVYPAASGSFRDVIPADINGDGKNDLIAVNGGEGKILVFQNNSSGNLSSNSFLAARVVSSDPADIQSAAILDLDNDGRLDLFYSTKSIVYGFAKNLLGTVAEISAAPSTLNSFSTSFGIASNVQTYSLNVKNLREALNIVAPTGFEFQYGAVQTFSNQVSTNFSFGTNPAFPIGLRLTGGQTGTISDTMRHSSSSISLKIPVSGNVTGGPKITVSSNSLPPLATTQGIPSNSNIYTVQGENLTDSLILTASQGLEIRRGGTTNPYSTRLAIGVQAASIQIETRLTGVTLGSFNGTITHTSTGAQSVTVSVLGTVNPSLRPSISSFTPTSANSSEGTPITIIGSGFNTTAANNQVRFGTAIATVTAATATQLTVTTPTNAQNDFISVTNTATGLTALSTRKFTPTISGSTAFAPSSLASTASLDLIDQPFSPKAVDFDNDGILDIIAAYPSRDSLVIFRNTNNPQLLSQSFFSSPLYLSTGGDFPNHLATGDFDGDGRVDIVCNNLFGGSISIFRNTSTSGSISFQAPIVISGFSEPGQVAIADIDNDGRLDLVVSNRNGTNGISLLRNLYSGGSLTSAAFQTAVNYSSGFSGNEFLAVGDLNGDSKVDIAVGFRNSATILIYQNNAGTGNFTATTLGTQVALNSVNPAYNLKLSDLDGDGRLDFVFTNRFSPVVVMFIQNNITSGSAISSQGFIGFVSYSAVSGNYNDVDASDIDGDGRNDLIVCNTGFTSQLLVYRNVSSPGALGVSSFASAVSARVFLSNVNEVLTADLDRDGRLDLITAQDPNLLTFSRNLTGTTPQLSLASGSLTTFATTPGVPSATQSFSLNVTNVRESISVSFPNGFEGRFGTSGSFQSQMTSSVVGGTLQNLTIQVRLAGTTSGNVSDSVRVTSSGATPFALAVSGTVTATSFVTVSSSTLNAFSSTTGTPSTAQEYTVSGSNLTGNVVITPPSGFEIRQGTSGSFQTSALSLAPSSGTLAITTIQVRLTGAIAGSFSGNITHTSTGATTQNVAVSGSVTTENPLIGLSTVGPFNFSTTAGTPSSTSQYFVNGRNLSDSLIVTPPAGFEVRRGGTQNVFVSRLAFARQGDSLPTTPIEVRLTGTSQGNFSGNITHASTGALTQTVAVSGNVASTLSSITVSSSMTAFSTSIGIPSQVQGYQVSWSGLTAQVVITAPTGYAIRVGNQGQFGSIINLSQLGGTVGPTAIQVRLTGQTAGTPSGQITHTSTGAAAQTVNVSGTVSAAVSSPISIAAQALPSVPNLSGQETVSNTSYRLTGLPGRGISPSDFGITQVDAKDWRIFTDNGTTYDLLQPASRTNIGEGVWVIARRGLTAPAFNGNLSLSNNRALIPVRANSWNIITNPFNTAVSWSAVQTATSVFGDLSGSALRGYNGAYTIENTMTPYVGYYVNIPAGITQLVIPNPATTTTLSTTEESQRFAENATDGWRLKIHLTTPENKDVDNELGVSSVATKGRDAFDYPEPPLAHDLAYLYFPHSNWDEAFPRYSVDIRPPFVGKEEWQFEVRSLKRGWHTIQVMGIESVPKGLEVLLVDESQKRVSSLSRSCVYGFAGTKDVMSFKVLVGDKTLLESEVRTLLPTEFALEQNFPNPFNPNTVIAYQLPQSGQVTLKVYDVLGREVTTLVNEPKEAGKYQVNFNAAKLASGVYFYQLKSGNFVQTKKMMLVK